MCGILGVFSPTELSRDLRFDEGLAALKHRGPDEFGTWFCESGRVALGHARLGIMDPDGGHQPMHFDGIHIAVNGEFYDFESISVALEKEGVRFQTRSDSEILIHLYRKYGISALDHLRGEFSFILWDENAQRFFVARDRFGIKPLYYCRSGEQLIVASEIKAIKALGLHLAWDEENLFNLTAGFVMDPVRTIFKDVYQVPPAHFLLKTPGEERIREYWNFNYDESNCFDLKQEAELYEQFDSLFRDSIKQRLRADVKVGCYLSGGIDSSAVLALASEIHDCPIRAFSISFEDVLYDESSKASEMAALAAADYSEIKISETDLADNFSNAIWHSEFVFANTHGIAKYLLSEHVREQGYKVVLTGEGADEALAGYPHFRQDLIRSGYTDVERESLLRKLDENNQVSRGLFVDTDFREIPLLESNIYMTPSYLQVHISAAERGALILNPDFYGKYSKCDVFDRVLSVIDKRPIANANAVNKANYLWNKTTFPSYVLTVLADRMEMAHSVEARLPFLDHPLFEFTQKLPLELKIRELKEKWILRETVKSKITRDVYETHKHPFTAPPSTLNPDGKLFAYVRDTLNSLDAFSLPYFEMKRLSGMLEKVRSMPEEQKGNLDAVISMVASLVELKRSFNL